jgi:LDH2 family malate/lactate/ureidoglycolate dehydrogenase
MSDATGGTWGWAKRWPRYLGVILLAAAAQSGLGAWAVGDAADQRPLAAYLGGCAVTAGIIGLVFCLVPLPVTRFDSQQRQVG